MQIRVTVAGADAGERQLALRALAGIEQDALGVPAQQVAVVVAVAGRDLARRAEHHQLPRAHAAGSSGRRGLRLGDGWRRHRRRAVAGRLDQRVVAADDAAEARSRAARA